MKYISILLLTIISITCQAQVAGNFKQVRLLNNTDSTFLGSTTGIIRYDPVTGKYRFGNALTQTWFTYNNFSANNFWKTSGTTNTAANTIIYGPSNNSGIIFDDNAILGSDGVFIGSGDIDNFITKRSWVTAYGTGDFAQMVQQTGTTNHYAQITNDGVDLYSQSAPGISLKFKMHPTTGAIFTDARTTKTGIQYAADYSANFTARSLVDKAYVDATATPTLTSTYVGYGSGANTLTGESAFNYTAASNQLQINQGSINVLGSNNGTSLLVEDDGGNNIIHVQELAGLTYVDMFGSGVGNFSFSTSAAITSTGPVSISGSELVLNTISNDDTETRLVTVENLTGKLEYRTVASITSSPAGSDTQIQFNNVGTFGADADLTFTGGNTLNATNATVSTNLTVSSLTSGRVPFVTTSGLITDESEFTYTSASNRLDIGSASAGQFYLGNLSGDSYWGVNSSTSNNVVMSFATNGVGQFKIQGAQQTNVSNIEGVDISIEGGGAYGSSGNGSGGDIILNPGDKRAAGSGSDGDVILTLNSSNGGYLIIQNIPTSSAGLPSGAVWSNAGILTIVP
jgi:hypothetical protein